MTDTPGPLSQRRIAAFWLPMAGTWLMMAVEGPFLAAVIARLAEPKFNLAAFGVAYAVAILVEAPVIMILSASTALVEGPVSLRRLRRFTHLLNGGATLSMVLLTMTPAWSLFAEGLLGLDAHVAGLTRQALWILLPWPAAIGFRRFYQGLLIRDGRTRRVAYGTVVRMGTMVAVGVGLFRIDLPGVWVGAAALTAGVCAEALAARLMTVRLVRRTLSATSSELDRSTGYAEIWTFYLPLALTSMIGIASQPMITFFVGRARFPLESLAVLPVVHSLSFLFRALGFSYQEVAIALLGRDWRHFAAVTRFAIALACFASAGQALIAFTPLSDVWFLRLSGLTPELAAYALLPVQILAIAPALSVMQALQRGMLVQARRTAPVSWGTAIEVIGIFAALLLTVSGLHWIGATAAAASFLTGRIAGNLYLIPPCLRLVRDRQARPAS